MGESFIKDGKIREAIPTYIEAQKLDSNLKSSANSWNSLCWIGSLLGYAKGVIFACENAVLFDTENVHFRNSRGLARALTGDTKVAIEDFEAYIKWAENEDEYNVFYASEVHPILLAHFLQEKRDK